MITTNKTISLLLFAGLLFAGLLQFKIAFFEQSSFSGPRRSTRLREYQINPAHLTKAASAAYLYQGKSDKALQLLRKALKLNPVYVPAWIALSELKAHQGNQQEALAILAYIDSLMVEVGPWFWQKTMLAYQLGALDMVADDIVYLVDKQPGERRKALDLAFSLWPDPETLLAKIGEQNRLHLFLSALRPERLDVALACWPLVRSRPELEKRSRLHLIELLRRRGDIVRAHDLWCQEIDSAVLLYNGDFSHPLLRTAFGWRSSQPAGTEWKLVDMGAGKTAFKLHFSGAENVNYYHLIQYMALPPGNYVLSGMVKCSDLTTDQRPYIEVVGVNARTPRAKTSMFVGPAAWQQFSLDFTVPIGCDQVYVRLRRNKSHYINNLIAGDLWLSQLQIAPAGSIDD